MKKFRILVIGQGSMGKRRVRCLLNLNYSNDEIYSFDPREDRVKEVEKLYGIKSYIDFDKALAEVKPSVFIISTPPEHHMFYAYYAAENNISCFIEASVVDAEKIINLSKIIQNKNILIVPSCTKKFYPAPKIIKKIVKENLIGDILNINYQKGQYLPDWHPWENIKDFYVSNPDTGGAREIVPFELVWLNDIFGQPKALTAVRKKITDIDAKIEDIYHFVLEYPKTILANITIEVVSRPVDSNYIRILGSSGIIVFDGNNDFVKYINNKNNEWKNIYFENKLDKFNKSESPYVDEIKSFIESVNNKLNNRETHFPSSLEEDYNSLKCLHSIEEISNGLKNLSN
jgi:predicted dehydrogenase